MRTKVNNMTSTNGNRIANQFIIETPEGISFQSYNSIICFEPKTERKKQNLTKSIGIIPKQPESIVISF